MIFIITLIIYAGYAFWARNSDWSLEKRLAWLWFILGTGNLFIAIDSASVVSLVTFIGMYVSWVLCLLEDSNA